MPTLSVPDRYLALAPIIITSPTTRCGTTLVQRLVSASDNAFIFGEDASQHIKLLTGLFFNFLRYLEEHGEELDIDFAKALAGSLRDWRPGLMPPADVMMRAWVETYYQIPAALGAFANSVGRPIWGFKCPAFSYDVLVAILAVLPKSKIVYVYRNLWDTLRSAKARKFVMSNSDVTEFCTLWSTNLTEVLRLEQDDRLMLLRYEDLMEDREGQLAKLSAFTGAAPINPKEFDVKVNTFVGDEAHGHSPTQYIAPATLTAFDQTAIISRAGPVLKKLYGDMRP